eukprot:3937078-Rhodomonas_salina.1
MQWHGSCSGIVASRSAPHPLQVSQISKCQLSALNRRASSPESQLSSPNVNSQLEQAHAVARERVDLPLQVVISVKSPISNSQLSSPKVNYCL